MGYTSDFLGLKQRLVATSGHEEIVADAAGGDWSDPTDPRILPASTIINDAIKWLDKRSENMRTDGWLYKVVPSGTSLITFQKARWVREVWIVDSGYRKKLNRKPYQDMRLAYADEELDSQTTGTPSFWTPSVNVLAPIQREKTSDVEGVTLSGTDPVRITSTAHGLSNGDTVYIDEVVGTVELNGNSYTVESVAADTFDLTGTDSSDFTAYTSGGFYTTDTDMFEAEDVDFITFDRTQAFLSKGLIIQPPPDSQRTVEILCAWYSNALTNDTDVCWWSLENPDLVVRAARLLMEVDLHRNKSGEDQMRANLDEEIFREFAHVIAEEEEGDPSDFRLEFPVL